jgi:hypothetical protein
MKFIAAAMVRAAEGAVMWTVQNGKRPKEPTALWRSRSQMMKPEYQQGAPMPASIGLCADLYSEVRELRLAMQKIVDDVKDRETEIREHIIQNLSKSSDTGAAGRRYRAQIVTKEVPTLKDWDALTKFVAANNRFDLLHKRIADGAVKDMWENKEVVPGVEKFNATDVSITKI